MNAACAGPVDRVRGLARSPLPGEMKRIEANIIAILRRRRTSRSAPGSKD